MRREEVDWAIPPVVGSSWRGVLLVELLDGEQFHYRNAERLQIRDFLDQARVGAAFGGFDPRIRVAREPADVQFVDNRAGEGTLQGNIPTPIICPPVDDDAFHGVRAVIAGT